MDQPPLTASPSRSERDDSEIGEPTGEPIPLPFLSAESAETDREDAFVVVVRDPLEFCRWLVADAPALQWIQAENLLGEPEVWATAARKGNDIPLDVIMEDPARDFAALYRLVDVAKVRSVRVTIPVVPGFLKSLRLAASIQLPVRLLPGQPGEEVLGELGEAVEFYLHDPMVEAPVEFFHSALTAAGGVDGPDLWISCEQDSEVFSHEASAPVESVTQHLSRLEEEGAECVGCSWKDFCLGYFKQPNPDYSCAGILRVFERIQEASLEMKRDLEELTSASAEASPPSFPES